MDEFERIEAIRQRLAKPGSDVRLGIGDDAAILSPSSASQVLSVDVSVEGVHFRRSWASLEQIGRRAFVAAASDLAAMGARPRAALLSLVVPQTTTDDELLRVVDGIAEGAEECGVTVIGGNLAAGGELSITTTVVGEVGERFLGREGARPGDQVWVTGALGGSALGLAFLEAGRGDEPAAAPFVRRWRHPTARFQISQRLLDVATAGIDISDGFLADLGHLCEASGVAATIHLGELPLPRGFEELARTLDRDPGALCLGGGEDYELLFTAPASEVAKELATRVGEIGEGGGVTVLDPDGAPIDVGARGYRHF